MINKMLGFQVQHKVIANNFDDIFRFYWNKTEEIPSVSQLIFGKAFEYFYPK